MLRLRSFDVMVIAFSVIMPFNLVPCFVWGFVRQGGGCVFLRGGEEGSTREPSLSQIIEKASSKEPEESEGVCRFNGVRLREKLIRRIRIEG